MTPLPFVEASRVEIKFCETQRAKMHLDSAWSVRMSIKAVVGDRDRGNQRSNPCSRDVLSIKQSPNHFLCLFGKKNVRKVGAKTSEQR